MNMQELVDNSSLTYAQLAGVLEDINTIRLAIGIGEGKIPCLLKGKPGDAEQCVLARALSNNGWEPEVNDSIILRNWNCSPEFDFKKAIATLEKKGLSADYSLDECFNSAEILIDLTDDMSILISEFDDKLLPSLISED